MSKTSQLALLNHQEWKDVWVPQFKAMSQFFNDSRIVCTEVG